MMDEFVQVGAIFLMTAVTMTFAEVVVWERQNKGRWNVWRYLLTMLARWIVFWFVLRYYVYLFYGV